MPSSKYVLQSTDSNIHIHINSQTESLPKEILSQLKPKPSLTITTSTHQLKPVLQVCHIYIHSLVSPKSVLESQNELQLVIDFCLKNFAKLVLILPAKNSDFKQTVIETVKKIGHEKQLQYFLYTLNPSGSVSENASKVISLFYYGHQSPSSSTNRPKLKHSLSIKKYLLAGVLIIIIPYFVLLVEFIAYFSLSWSTLNQIRSQKTYTSTYFATPAASLSTLLLLQSNLLPGVKTVLNGLGLPLFQLSQASQNLSIHLSDYHKTIDYLSKNGVKNSSDLLSQFSYNSDSTGLLQSSLKDLYLQSPKLSPVLLQLGQQLSASHQIFYKLSQLGPEYQKFFPPHKIRYLIVIQDANELRPTGGFIDSFIYLTLDSGQISQVQIFSSSQADSHLVGQVSPPPTLQSSLGGSQWLVRDANWDPDFPETAQKISWFIDKELSLPVDAVIGINTKIVPDLLKITGPIKIPNFSNSLNAQNYQSAYLSSLDNSKQNNFISETLKACFTQIGNLTPSQLSDLFQLLTKNLEARQILIYPITFNSPILGDLGWDGGVRLSNCSSAKNCFKDIFYYVDTNTGLIKNNVDIAQSVSLKTLLSPNLVNSKISVQYQNQNSKVGDSHQYSDFVRVYLPPTAVLDAVSLSGKTLLPTEYSVTYEHHLQVLSTKIILPPKSQIAFEFSYHQNLSTNQPFHYQLDIPNQPGRSFGPLDYELNFPPNWQVTAYTQAQSPVPPVATAGQLRYNTTTGQLTKLDLDILPTP